MNYLGLLTDWRVFELLPLVKKLWGRDRATNWKIINIEWFLRVGRSLDAWFDLDAMINKKFMKNQGSFN